MPENGPLIRISDIPAALGLLTRLPVPVDGAAAEARGAASAWAYPLAGAVVGGIAWLAGAIAASLGLTPALVAGLVLTTMIVTTGALHEDGLADTADGLWGGWTPERRLEIMKDSRIGAYGVIALILSLGLRWAALTALIQSGQMAAVVAVAILSRAPMAVLMNALPNARGAGLSARVGRPGPAATAVACGLALALALPLVGAAVLPAFLALILATAGIAVLAHRKIGGQTGDILGAGQQIGELAVLLGLVAAAA